MFDWDKDYDDLVKGDAVASGADENAPVPAHAPRADAAPTSLRVTMARWFAPVLVVAGLGAGVTFPEQFGLGEKPVQTAALFAPFPAQSVSSASQVTLRAYSDAQHRNFVFGLKRFTDADLLAYAAVTQTDLDRAGSVLAPLMQDALTLTQLEIERRNLVQPNVVRSVQDVVIQTPLQG